MPNDVISFKGKSELASLDLSAKAHFSLNSYV